MDWNLVGRADELASVVDSISSGRSVLLTGASGVGKSRLADEVRAILEASHHVERIIGSPSLAELPFGAVAHLAGDAPLPEPSALVTFITHAIRRRAARRPIAVIIDDLNELDDGSLALVQNLLAHESIPVLGAVRTEGAGDPRVVPLWKDGLMERRQLPPLSRPETDQLVRTITGGVCASEMLNELWRLTEGHPLFIREVLLEGLDQGAITNTDGLWTVTGPLGTSQRLVDIVAARTDHLGEAERAALGIVAICEPIPLEHARRLAEAEILESLESKRMIRLETTGDGPAIRTSHPLVGEVTVSRMRELTRINATARLARVLLESPSPSFRDSMLASKWLLDAGEQPPMGAALNGARAALRAFDPQLARRLAEAALASADSPSAMVLLGRAHAAEADAERAVTVLQDAQEGAFDDSQIASATTALAEVYMFILGDTARAIRELEKSLELVSEVGPRAEISSHLMMAAGMTGDFDLGLKIGPGVADRTDLPGPSQLNSVMVMTLTQTMTGKLSEIERRLELGERLAERYSDFQPLAPDQVGMNRLLAHHAKGEFEAADSLRPTRSKPGSVCPGPGSSCRRSAERSPAKSHEAFRSQPRPRGTLPTPTRWACSRWLTASERFSSRWPETRPWRSIASVGSKATLADARPESPSGPTERRRGRPRSVATQSARRRWHSVPEIIRRQGPTTCGRRTHTTMQSGSIRQEWS